MAIEYDEELAWCVDDNEIDCKDEDMTDKIVDAIWDDFDESQWIRDNYNTDDLWDAILHGKDYDDFKDEMDESIRGDARTMIEEEFDRYDSRGKFEVYGCEYYRLATLTVEF